MRASGADDGTGGPRPSATSPVAERVLDVLIAFTQGGGEMGVTEIARAVGLDKSRVHRFLTALRNKGFVVANPKTRRYSLGFRIFELGRAAAQLDIEALAQPVLDELRDRTGETAVLAACIGCERVYLAQAESRHQIRQHFQVGERRPIPRGASGRVFLAFMSDVVPCWTCTTARRRRIRRSA